MLRTTHSQKDCTLPGVLPVRTEDFVMGVEDDDDDDGLMCVISPPDKDSAILLHSHRASRIGHRPSAVGRLVFVYRYVICASYQVIHIIHSFSCYRYHYWYVAYQLFYN